MKLASLIRMANQIGAFFEAMPDRRQAVIDVASHLQRTWEPRMRAQLLGALDGHDAQDMKVIVRDAAQILRQELASAPREPR